MIGHLQAVLRHCRWHSQALAVSIAVAIVQTIVSWHGLANGPNETLRKDGIVLGRVAYEDRIDHYYEVGSLRQIN